MRVPDSDPIGRFGLEETKADFSRIKWGANENLHDVGTDLVIAVSDARGFDLGILVGAQVKSGSSWFSEPTSDPDQEGGGFALTKRTSTTGWATTMLISSSFMTTTPGSLTTNTSRQNQSNQPEKVRRFSFPRQTGLTRHTGMPY
jgi:hypothetical protein